MMRLKAQLLTVLIDGERLFIRSLSRSALPWPRGSVLRCTVTVTDFQEV